MGWWLIFASIVMFIMFGLQTWYDRIRLLLQQPVLRVAQIKAVKELKILNQEASEAQIADDLASADVHQKRHTELIDESKAMREQMKTGTDSIVVGMATQTAALVQVCDRLASNSDKLDLLLGTATEPEPDTPLVVTKGSSESEVKTESVVEEPTDDVEESKDEDDGLVPCANPDCSETFKGRGNKRFHNSECRKIAINKNKKK